MKTVKQSDWQTQPLPAEKSTVPLDRRFSEDEVQRLRLGLVPQEMEDKWFVYWQDDTLFFHRSWTGNCIYAVRFARDGDSYRMVEADVNRHPDQYTETDDDRDARLISYLIDVLLLAREAPFPGDEVDPQRQAIMKWSLVGRAMLGEHPRQD